MPRPGRRVFQTTGQITSADLRAAQVRGRSIAKRKYALTNATCSECHYATATDRHHADGNAHNNEPTNVWLVCRPCHTRHHSGARWHADRATNRWMQVA